jgi:TonB family protein
MSYSKRSLRVLITAIAIGVGAMPIAFAQHESQDKPEPPKIIRKSGGVLQGSATKRVEPAYPPLAKAARVSGSVVVEVTIDEEGNVFAARAISGHPLLKDAAVSAAKEWTFTQTVLTGVPVKVISTITFNFNLDYKREIKSARRELAAKPNSAQLHYELADLLRSDRQYDESLAEYNQALALDGRHVEAFIGLATLYQSIGRFDESIDAAKHGLELAPQPGHAETLNLFLGEAYLKLERNQEALEAFKQAVAAKSDSIEGHFQLGVTYLKLGDKQSAYAQYSILKDMGTQMADVLQRSIEKDN